MPRWETEENLEDERQAGIRFSEKFGVRMEKLHKDFFLDFAVYRKEKLWCFVEVKRRHYTFGKYEDVILSNAKTIDAVHFAMENGVPAIFMGVFDDDDHCCRLRDDFPTKIGGRYDRNCVGRDVELVSRIPLIAFKTLREV